MAIETDGFISRQQFVTRDEIYEAIVSSSVDISCSSAYPGPAEIHRHPRVSCPQASTICTRSGAYRERIGPETSYPIEAAVRSPERQKVPMGASSPSTD